MPTTTPYPWEFRKVPIEWCWKELSLAQAEEQVTQHLNRAPILFPFNMPPEQLERVHSDSRKMQEDTKRETARQWASIKQALRLGDRLMSFEAPPEEWKRQSAMTGIALVRESRVLSYVALFSQ